jgi:hypothetical protein
MSYRLQLLLYTVFLLTIFVLAYMGLIPTKLKAFPDYDSVGHFMLYGLWCYFFASAFQKPVARISKVEIQLGALVVATIAVAEELLQKLSPIRKFSYFDMGWGLLGITLACLIVNWRRGMAVERNTDR